MGGALLSEKIHKCLDFETSKIVQHASPMPVTFKIVSYGEFKPTILCVLDRYSSSWATN